MPAPASPVDVVNLALAQLRQQPITSLNDVNNVASLAANGCYDTIRQSLLRNYMWNFSTQRTMAPQDTTYVIPFDYAYAYQLPNPILAVWWVGYDWRRYCPIPYDFQDTHILLGPLGLDGVSLDPTMPWPSLAVKYSADITNVAQMDSLFIQAFKWLLAKELAMPVTGNMELVKFADDNYKIALAEAKAIQHIENPVIVTDPNWIGESRLVTSENYQYPIPSSWWGDVDAQ